MFASRHIFKYNSKTVRNCKYMYKHTLFLKDFASLNPTKTFAEVKKKIALGSFAVYCGQKKVVKHEKMVNNMEMGKKSNERDGSERVIMCACIAR